VTTPLTSEEIAELRRLEREAPPGPWRAEGPGDGWGDHIALCHAGDGGGTDAIVTGWSLDTWAEAVRLVVAMRAALPRLLDLAESRSSPAALTPETEKERT
jgi:hypothetical protein